MDSDHDFDWIPQDGAYCYASLARRLHVMSVEDEVHEEVTSQKVECMKSSLQSRSFIQLSLSLVSIHYNESQANLPLDDDDVHFQRWLLELLSASISPMIMAAIKYSSGIERRGTRVIIKTIYLLQIPIKIQEVVFVSFYYKAPPHSG